MTPDEHRQRAEALADRLIEAIGAADWGDVIQVAENIAWNVRCAQTKEATIS